MAREETVLPHDPSRREARVDGEVASTSPPSDTRPIAAPLSGATVDFGLAADRRGSTGDPLVGANLDGVVVEALVGQGGMGRVYRARQMHPSRTVAVKVMRGAALGPDAVQRFRREADALARLRHPGIAQIFLAGCHRVGIADVPYFVMEFIPAAETLVQACDRRGLSSRDRLALLLAVCEAVGHGHAAGIVHRDLKPGNILVDASGCPKIIDFGIARVDQADDDGLRTETGHFMGTRPYMAPEQFAEGRVAVDARTDVYSLGLLMHEVIAGTLPYDVANKSLLETAQVVQHVVPAPLALPAVDARERALAAGAAAIAARCLQKAPAARYRSATELADDLRRLLAGDAPAALVDRGSAARGSLAAWMAPAAVAVTVASIVVAAATVMRPAARRPAAGDSAVATARTVSCRFPLVSSGRTSPLEWIDLGFDEEVSGVVADDFRLTRDGEPISTAGLTISGGPKDWRIGGLARLTADAGEYTLAIAGTPTSPVDRDGRVVTASARATWRSPAYREIRFGLLDDDWDRHIVGLDHAERYTERSAGSTTFIRPTVPGREGVVTMRFDLPFTIQDATLTAPISVWTTGDPFPYDPGARAAIDVSRDGSEWTRLAEVKAGAGGSNGERHDISGVVAGGTRIWVRARLTATKTWPKDGLIFAQFLRTNPGEKESELLVTATGPHPPVIPDGGR